jgi:hypothetical protein
MITGAAGLTHLELNDKFPVGNEFCSLAEIMIFQASK